MTGGCMIAVVGPSGAGKDSLMQWAARDLARRDDIGFVRRAITRPADAGGEAHLAVTARAFEEAAAAGAYAVAWRAHGLGYGLPAATLAELAAGRCLVANGSRAALADFARAYPRLAVVQVTARRDCLMERLMARGRESPADITARLDRPEAPLPPGLALHVIDNSGALDEAGRALSSLIAAIADARK